MALVLLTGLVVHGQPNSPKEIIASVIKNNVEVNLAYLDYEIAQAELNASNLDFDYFLTINPMYQEDYKMPNTTLDYEVYKDVTSGWSFGLKKKFDYGTQPEIVWQDLKLASSSQRAVAPERYQTAIRFKVTQPLLKGRSLDYNREKTHRALVKTQKYRVQFFEKVIEKCHEVLTSYFDFIKVEANLVATKQVFESEKKRLELIANKFKWGRTSETDFLMVKSQTNLKAAEVMDLESLVADLREKLEKETTGISENTSVSIPGFTANEIAAPKTNRLSFEAQESEVDLKKAEKAELPQLDFTLSYSSLGGANSRSESADQLINLEHPGWSAGLRLSMPFGNNAAEGQRAIVLNTYYRKVNAVKEQKNKDQTDEADRLRKIQVSEQNLESLRQRIQLTRDLIKIKERLYGAGRLNLDELIESNQAYYNLLKDENEMVATINKTKIPSLIQEYFKSL